ncbi:hypothetical protein [Acidithiobacillus caldus]|uniref:hypothetical protein n=1 Tax=Acidithiobacillus caldus TaxID=33059 RepID=UPI0011D25ED3|nr:hypothetical protein [Acidithiobacillus caldus]
MNNPHVQEQNPGDRCPVCGRRDWERGGWYRLADRKTIHVLRCRNCRTVQRVPHHRFFQVAATSGQEFIR